MINWSRSMAVLLSPLAGGGIPASLRRERPLDQLNQKCCTLRYILYLTGFAFAPTERPLAFVMNGRGEKALFVPRLEVEHARAQTGFERVDHYPEYPDD